MGEERTAGAEKLGAVRVGGGDERKLGADWVTLGAERDGCEKLGGFERYDGAGADGVERIDGCCCAKPELGGVR